MRKNRASKNTALFQIPRPVVASALTTLLTLTALSFGAAGARAADNGQSGTLAAPTTSPPAYAPPKPLLPPSMDPSVEGSLAPPDGTPPQPQGTPALPTGAIPPPPPQGAPIPQSPQGGPPSGPPPGAPPPPQYVPYGQPPAPPYYYNYRRRHDEGHSLEDAHLADFRLGEVYATQNGVHEYSAYLSWNPEFQLHGNSYIGLVIGGASFTDSSNQSFLALDFGITFGTLLSDGPLGIEGGVALQDWGSSGGSNPLLSVSLFYRFKGSFVERIFVQYGGLLMTDFFTSEFKAGLGFSL